MNTLIDFLRARLDDEDRLAREADANKENGWWWGPDAESAPERHIAHWDPTRVLAEIAAKRRILNVLEPFAAFDMHPVKAQSASREEWYVVTAARDAIKLLALPYAGHPHYREEWALNGYAPDAKERIAALPDGTITADFRVEQ